MRRRALLAAASLPLVSSFLAVSSSHAAAQEATPRAGLLVVATISVLADLVRQVGGDAVSVVSLVPAGTDVHGFQPSPGGLRRLRDARVAVENGLGLEGWLDRAIRASGFSGTRVVAAAGVRPRLMQEGGRAVPDPHVWQDPGRAVLMVRAIADGLAAADPARAAHYRDRATAYTARIEAVDAEIERRMAAIPPSRRRVITGHDAFGYFGARYGVEFLAVQGVSAQAEPSARDLARLAAQARREGVRAVFVENMTSPRAAEALAREAGARVGGTVYSDDLSPPDGPAGTYLDMLRHNARLFAEAMAGPDG